jgi:predicted dehydrogenase
MKTLIIGKGTSGVRHESILNKLDCEIFTVSNHTPISYANFHSLSDALEKVEPKYVVVSNETAQHLTTLIELEKLDYKGKVLVEKPLDFKSYSGNFAFEKIGVGFNLRFLPSIIELKKILTENRIEIYAAQINYGNLYTNWRDVTRVSEQYSSIKNKGGGVLRDFSHEIDLVIWLFGKPKINFATGGKLGEITIDSDDCWDISASTTLVPMISLHLDCLDSMPKREIRLLTSLGTICVDVKLNKIFSFNGEFSFDSGVEDTYKLMHMDMISSKGNLVATIEEALQVDEIIYSVETFS